MSKKMLTGLLCMIMVASLLPTRVLALSTPVSLKIQSVSYNEDQSKLIVKGVFVNAGNASVLAVGTAAVEIKVGSTVVASQSFDIMGTKKIIIPIGDGEAWTFQLDNPVTGMNLSGYTAETQVTYNFGKATEVPEGKKVYYNGTPIGFDTPITVINGRMMIPARAVFEKMGARVAWNAESQSVTVTRDKNNVILTVGNELMISNGKPEKLDVPAQIIDGRTLVPLRAIGDALGAEVAYDSTYDMAIIFED